MSQARLEQINEILKDLEDLKKRGFENMYAVEENIKFFRALYSLPRYARWLIKEMPKIDGSRLLELSDFHLHNGKWESILQKELLALEKKKIPDVLRGLRKEIVKQIENLAGAKEMLLLVSVGSGTMEIERQVVRDLRARGSAQKITFVGIDNSEASIKAAQENLAELYIPIAMLQSLDSQTIQNTLLAPSSDQYKVFIFNGDALKLEEYFQPKSVDIVFHSRFKHHLPDGVKDKFDEMLTKTSNKIIEHDDLNGWFLLLFSTIFNWRKPILMNGAVFSCLRDPKKKFLQESKNSDWRACISFDCYVRTYNDRL